MGYSKTGAQQTLDFTESRRVPYNGLPPYVKNSATSKAAALHIAPKAGSMRARVLEFIRSMGTRGATDDEIEVALELKHQTASARRRELVLGNWIHSIGRRKTRSGCTANVWALRDVEVELVEPKP